MTIIYLGLDSMGPDATYEDLSRWLMFVQAQRSLFGQNVSIQVGGDENTIIGLDYEERQVAQGILNDLWARWLKLGTP